MATIKYFGQLRALAGIRQEDIDAATVRALLKQVKDRYGDEAYQKAKRSHIIVDGQNAALIGGFSAKLDQTSEVQLLPVCGGG